MIARVIVANPLDIGVDLNTIAIQLQQFVFVARVECLHFAPGAFGICQISSAP